ncbi:Mobile element protein [Thermodesulfovibrio sp. N1]|uniref:IS256 family transposase n=1 Tax=Thermodesulfovibrio sp. N1 TaxID=1871110 RepID=UPI0008587396|nr:IS256 family transposase [Thermodesulfovibrio sp. N1]ODA43219.1 Mobile element protein [Thermodesulfovibrio sp. N1]
MKKRKLKKEEMEKMGDLNLEKVLDEISKIDSREGIKTIAALLLNELMKKEREIYLRESIDNKANGYYERQLACFLGNLGISVPRDRKSEFRPAILPSEWQKADESFQEFILNLVLQSYSPNKIKALLQSMNLPYSAEQIEEIKEDLYNKAKELKTKELPSDMFSLFIDAYHTQIKDEETNRIKKAVIYNIMGIDMEGRKSLVSYYIYFGSESKEDWLQILNDLIKRGLKRVMVIVSDDFPGLSHAIKNLFPQTDHQLCFLHMQRNIKKNMSKQDTKQFYEELTLIKRIEDYEKAVMKFEELCKGYEKKYPAYIKGLLNKKDNYFNYKKYPEAVRKYIYTTNVVENINSRIELIRANTGGYFQSIKTAEVAIYVTVSRIEKNKWKEPLPLVKSALYELKQMFVKKFYGQTQFS